MRLYVRSEWSQSPKFLLLCTCIEAIKEAPSSILQEAKEELILGELSLKIPSDALRRNLLIEQFYFPSSFSLGIEKRMHIALNLELNNGLKEICSELNV